MSDTEKFTFEYEMAEKFLRLVQKFEHVIGHWDTENIVFEPWQNWVWMNIMGFYSNETGYRRFRIAHVEVARGNAKCFHILTKVPTPDGLKLWGDITVGSRLYDRKGNICTVTKKKSVHRPEAREVTFSDGSKIICSDGHLWFTEDVKERDRRRSGSSLPHESIKTTDEIMATLKYSDGSNNHAIRLTESVSGGSLRLQHSYFWGYWIGNGSTNDTKVSSHSDDGKEIRKYFIEDGMDVSELSPVNGKRALSFRAYGIRNNRLKFISGGRKHIPEWIFKLNKKDRHSFFMGLMDSDGTCHVKTGLCAFGTIDKKMANAVKILACSFGYRATVQKEYIGDREYDGKKRSNWFYRVSFSVCGKSEVFRLKRKQSRVYSKSPSVGLRYIVSVKKLPSDYDMFCVEVDSPDKSYLIGEGHIPTHNSTMASQAALYFLALENPKGNQISTVATGKEQARIVLDAAREMARKAVGFRNNTGVKVLAHTITHEKSGSKIRALASDSSRLDGLQDILAVCDELHAMKRETFEVVYSGMSKRKDSLTLCITTAGFDVDAIGFSQSAYAKKVSCGEVSDDQFFAVVYTVDEKDDIYDSSNWVKANPGYGSSVDPHTFEAKAKKAEVTPTDVPGFKVKHLNIWLSEANAYYDQNKWDLCADPTLKIENFIGEKCFVAVDLATKVDLSSLAYVFKKDGVYYVFDKSYIPEERLKEIRNVLFDDCVASGHLLSMPGEAINYSTLEKEIRQDSKKFKFQDLHYDPWNATGFAQSLTSDGISLVEFRQSTANLSEPTKELDALMRTGKIKHNGSPLLRWCLGNVVCKEDAASNIFPKKTHERLKIDPIIAIIMALAGWVQTDQKESVYEGRGIRIL